MARRNKENRFENNILREIDATDTNNCSQRPICNFYKSGTQITSKIAKQVSIRCHVVGNTGIHNPRPNKFRGEGWKHHTRLDQWAWPDKRAGWRVDGHLTEELKYCSICSIWSLVNDLDVPELIGTFGLVWTWMHVHRLSCGAAS